MNKTSVFLQLKSEIIYRNDKSNVKSWANNSTGVLWWGQICWNLLSNHTPENEEIFYLLNIWNWSELRGKNKIMVYTVTLDPLAPHHFILLLGDGQLYKTIWNTKILWTGDLLVLFKFPTLEKHFSFLFNDWSCKKLQSLLKSQMAAAFSGEQFPAFTLFSFPPLFFNSLLSLSELQNFFFLFFSSSEMDFKHQSIRKRQIIEDGRSEVVLWAQV